MREHKLRNDNSKLAKLLKDDHEVEVLFYDEVDDMCYHLESVYRPHENIGCNICPGGNKPPYHMNSLRDQNGENNPMYGKKHSEETRKLLSKKAKARGFPGTPYHESGRDNPAADPVDIYNYQTDELVAENVLLTEFAKENNLNKGHLSSTKTGKRNHTGGFYAKQRS